MAKKTSPKDFLTQNRVPLLWTGTGIALVGLLFARAVFADQIVFTILSTALLLACLGLLIRENQKALRSRAAAYGYTDLQLETGTAQPEALALYEAAGWHRIPSYGRYKDDPDSVCFAKPV